MIRRREVLLGGAFALFFTTAPTVGDVGGCGTTPTALDPALYAKARKTVDCQRCSACALHTARCNEACDPAAPPAFALPPSCHPLYHDGEVCVRALKAASCGDYASFVSDVAPSAPSECEFCRDIGDGGGE